MTTSFSDILKNNIKKMVYGIGINNAGNIHHLLMSEVECSIIKIVLQETHYNLVQTAKLLGISRTKLYRKIKTYNLPSRKEIRESFTTK